MIGLKVRFIKGYIMKEKICMRYTDLIYVRIRKALVTFVYVLQQDFVINLPHGIAVAPICYTNHLVTYEDSGRLIIKKGFAWDGPSGPSIDTEAFLLASLVHDALYYMMATRCIDRTEKNRLFADDIMRELNLLGGMSRFRAWYTYKAVRLFGASHIKNKRKHHRIKGSSHRA